MHIDLLTPSLSTMERLGRRLNVHIDLLTPSLSTMERLGRRLNVQSMVGNHSLLLWLRRRGVTPSARSSRAPLLLLPLSFVSFRVSYRFMFQVTPH